ncbi:hypothetical protein [Wolbachia endosymbiont of Pentidionis agamae]|uniref:hypothetical protein n=1 Tax=Wolbachia endosymbiont of Pentidionis agamae TaxID=3110435 RepID=UPI002FD70E95
MRQKLKRRPNEENQTNYGGRPLAFDGISDIITQSYGISESAYYRKFLWKTYRL